MESDSRLLGRLEEHAKITNERLKSIEDKIESQQIFKWKLLGASVAVSFIVSAGIGLAEIYK